MNNMINGKKEEYAPLALGLTFFILIVSSAFKDGIPLWVGGMLPLLILLVPIFLISLVIVVRQKGNYALLIAGLSFLVLLLSGSYLSGVAEGGWAMIPIFILFGPVFLISLLVSIIEMLHVRSDSTNLSRSKASYFYYVVLIILSVLLIGLLYSVVMPL